MAGLKFNLSPQDVPKIKTGERSIQTALPAEGTESILKRLEKVESRSMHGQLPIVWKKAIGHHIYDIADNQFIDFTSAIFVTNVGHSNPRVNKYMQRSLETPLYSCYAYANETRANYLEKLIEFAGPPFEKAFLLSAGTEATEAAFKLMRMHGERRNKKRRGVICIENNWHGRTLGAQMLSSNEQQKAWIGNLDPDIHHIPFPYPWTTQKDGLDTLEKGLKLLQDKGINLKEDVCGFMLETFQGWGAVFYPTDYVQAIEKLCRQYDLLLAFDEMQAGFARTGRAFGYQHYGVSPDLLCCGKGMGGGVPLSGVIGRADVMDLPEIGNMSSTHSANPLVCEAGLAVLEEIEEKNMVSATERKGKLLFTELNNLKLEFPSRIKYVLGHGLLAAIHIFHPDTDQPDGPFTSRVAEKCMQKGLLVVHTGRESIKIGPPLSISDEAIKEGVAVLRESILEAEAE